jgi:hypothetical protein
VGGEEEGRGRHGGARGRGRMALLVVAVVRRWLSRRRCEIREGDFVSGEAIAVTRRR